VFRETREVNGRLIVVFLAVDFFLTIFINQVVQQSDVFASFFAAINNATGGLITSNLLNQLPGLLIIVFGIFFWWAKLRPRDLGLIGAQIASAILLTLLIWLIAQILVALYSVLTTGSIHSHPDWTNFRPTVVLGWLLGQVFGIALFEEVRYRGFLLAQFYLKPQRFSSHWRIIFATFAALLVFTLLHIPNRIMMGYAASELVPELLIVFGWGLFLTIIYLVTRNLFITIGVHALINEPTLLFEAGFAPQIAVALAAVGVLAASWCLRRQQEVVRHEMRQTTTHQRQRL
jgi:uncharacterized protein